MSEHDGWRKSSFSNGAGECVEFKRGPNGEILIRDSKNPDGAVVQYDDPEVWRAFLGDIKQGLFDV